MTHPYRGRPGYSYWKSGVQSLRAADIDPVVSTPFRIASTDAVATAGSCFAQHIARFLSRQGFNYMITETTPQNQDAEAEGFAMFTARYGNIYTVRQLLQLFTRAYGLVIPNENTWKVNDCSWVDPFRPRIRKTGWPSVAELEKDRKIHLSCVREMFESCDVFIFTLGLTECWTGAVDGMAYPLAPGAIYDCDDTKYKFTNMRTGEMVVDLIEFIDKLRIVNPGVRIILTVSPVPLIATAEDRHVLVSNTYSKAALRVVAEEVSSMRPNVAYFPSYEIIAGQQAESRYYADDLRSVTDEGIAHVMSIFSRHYLSNAEGTALAPSEVKSAPVDTESARRFETLAAVICDEESLVKDM
ncbi:GSCFA domain-containing protein [Azospirillum argentinense]